MKRLTRDEARRIAPNGTYHPQHLAASWFSTTIRQCLIRSFSTAATQSTAAMRSIGSVDLPNMTAPVCTLRMDIAIAVHHGEATFSFAKLTSSGSRARRSAVARALRVVGRTP